MGGHGQGHSHERIGHIENVSRSEYDAWKYAIFATLLISCAPVVILYLIPIDSSNEDNQSILNTLLGFAVGGLLGDVFLHLLPHAIQPHSHDHGHSHSHEVHDHSRGLTVGLWVLAGIVIFFLIDKFVRSINSDHSHGHSHGHSHAQKEKKEEKKESKEKKKEKKEKIKIAAWLNLAADFSHNFTDGLAMGVSFLTSNRLGWITTFAILIHEIPHEIGDFAILVQSGYSKRKAMLLQFGTAVGAMIGTVIGLLSQNIAESTIWILPFTAGGFIYVATVSVIPDLLKDVSFWQSVREVLAMFLGIALMVGITFIE